MLENGEKWSHAQMEQYCPNLPHTEVLSRWADVEVLRPDLACDFATAVYQVEESPPGRETALRGPIPEPASGGPADGSDAADG